MKSELEQIHAELLAAIGELETLTAEPCPDVDKLSAVRWKLSKASNRRLRWLEERLYPQIRLLDGQLSERLQRLREEGAALRTQSTAHVGTWTIADIVKDWRGYRQASQEMRRTMRTRIDQEREAVAALADALDRKGSKAHASARSGSAAAGS